MPDYILLMHTDSDPAIDQDWNTYLAKLRAAGVLLGGSAMGAGQCMRRDGSAREISQRIGGFIRIQANDLEHVRQMLIDNPVFEAGGTIEIRELLRSD